MRSVTLKVLRYLYADVKAEDRTTHSDIARRNSKMTEMVTADLYSACLQYLEGAVSFLNGKRKAAPSPRKIIAARLPHGVPAREEDGEVLGRRQPTIAADIKDDEGLHTRYFDPWYFAAMRLMELAGGRFDFDLSKRKYYYVAYFGPAPGKAGKHYMTRVIANTPHWAGTRHAEKKDEHGYRDYRRIALRWRSKADILLHGQETKSHSRERDDAIGFALKLYCRKGEKDALPTPSRFEEVLRAAFDIADAMHEKSLLTAVDKKG